MGGEVSTGMKCPFCDFTCMKERDLAYHMAEHQGVELAPTAITKELAKMITADMIPKSKIEAKIAFYEKDNARLKNTNFSSFMNNNDTRIQVLKELLSEE